MAGTLFVVATPIGNLEDLTFRALRTLKEVDLIAAEDTRRTLKLLSHYGIRKPMVSLHAHNETRETPKLVARLERGDSVALVSDAGTPAISDPGEWLVRAALAAGINVTPIPGPSAITAALSVSGLPAGEFVFMGFVPRSGKARAGWLQRLSGESRTVVFFEAPHRLSRILADVRHILVNRPIMIHKELSKIHEKLVKYSSTDDHLELAQRGEFVIVVGGAPAKTNGNNILEANMDRAVVVFDCLTNNCECSIDEACVIVSGAFGLEASVIRKAAKRARIAHRRREDALS